MAAPISQGIIAGLRKENEKLKRALGDAAVRLGILADRIEGCNEIAKEEGRAPVHELVDEARDFESIARKAAGLGKR